ncbi:hypothetical protein QBC35DRAFT_287108 [Podospora australis]|uniref:C2H2-type domain-containing protein n=1 Tax=Podospora australis TaxID=1536484 RepID=A0AAN6WR67_9PEZI|nr:hypothetical protein QBC35DRAFT_287108 [Podospora australis]
MPPRNSNLPPAQTASAREALQHLYCQLCQKGYSRMNDYQAHLSSYDHSHKQRLKDMKAMVKGAGTAQRKEDKPEGMVSIKLGEAAAGSTSGGFKKGGFKKTGFKAAFVPVGTTTAGAPTPTTPAATAEKKGDISTVLGAEKPVRSELLESDTEDEGYEVYDPRKPTD